MEREFDVLSQALGLNLHQLVAAAVFFENWFIVFGLLAAVSGQHGESDHEFGATGSTMPGPLQKENKQPHQERTNDGD